jgi:hypothetical protein
MIETPEIRLWPRRCLAKRGINAEADIQINLSVSSIQRLKSLPHHLQDFGRTAADPPDRASGQELRPHREIRLIQLLRTPYRVVSYHPGVTNHCLKQRLSENCLLCLCDLSNSCKLSGVLPAIGCHNLFRPSHGLVRLWPGLSTSWQ